jgi:diguanylate cyclase (GGDEF)-like protein/PAS domain S-box-containing protein
LKKRYLFIFIFLLGVFSYLFLKHEKDKKIADYLSHKTKEYSHNYSVLYSKYKKFSEIIFRTKINTDEVKTIFKETIDADDKQKAIIRKKLYNHLKETYSLLKDYNIKQLHFHLPNNDSFLRFHKPLKFGDNLTNIRSTVKYVNETKKPIDGFEEGRIYNGYRFVFPMFFENNHIGSVEISFSTLAMNIELMKNFELIGKFLILKDVVSQKVFQSEQSNYAQSSFEDYYYEKKIESALKIYNKNNLELKVSDETKKEVHKNISNDDSFSFYDSDSDTIMTFLKIKNPTSKKSVGMFVLRSDSSVIKVQEKNFIRLTLGTFIFLMLLFYFIYRILDEKERLAILVESKTKELNDSKYEMQEYIDLVDKNIIVSFTDLNGVITKVSDAFCKISGYSKDELIGANHNIIRHPDMPKKVFKNLWSDLKLNKTWKGEVKNCKKNGDYYWVEATISPVFDKNGKKVGYTGIRQDISDKKYIEEISITDGLTNIFNRRHFNNIFPKVINSAKRHNELVAFLILDIDHFKQYNDIYGHQLGDEALIKIAGAIKNTLKRADDFCFRLGGEEFAVIFKVDREEQAKIFSNTIRKNIENLQIEHRGNSISSSVTASMGLVCKYAKDIKDEDEVYSQADELLYKAKRNGRNRVAING